LRQKLNAAIQQALLNMPRTFGEIKIAFGARLNLALNEAEAKAPDTLISAHLLWDCLKKQSSILKLTVAKHASDDLKAKEFEPMIAQGVDNEKTSAPKEKKS